MLNAMVDHARIIVFKAVANTTKAPAPPVPLTDDSKRTGTGRNNDDPAAEASASPSSGGGGHGILAQPQVSNPSSLSRFRSALSLSTSSSSRAESPSMQKARCSALRLNSVLHHGKGGDVKTVALGPRRVRSVKWDSPLQLPRLTSALAPSPKKQRMADTAAKLKSFKSFGRPHAGDFGSGPRNATFGEYGGRAHLWGRDGRMAHHPSPMQGTSPMSDQIGLTGVPDKNATFDFFSSKKPASSANAASPGAAASSIPRSTTGLEKWLISTSTR